MPDEPADDPVEEPSFPYAAALRRARGGAAEEMIAEALRIERAGVLLWLPLFAGLLLGCGRACRHRRYPSHPHPKLWRGWRSAEFVGDP